MQEINDLKNIVIQSLESNGVLSQLRAQIRSSVFKIIEDQESREGRSPAFHWENPLCQKIHKTSEGPIALELMHEFMEFYRMDYTCNIFVHEANYKATTERQALITKLGLGNADSSKPLLAIIIDRLANGGLAGAKTNGAFDQRSTPLSIAPASASTPVSTQPGTNMQDRTKKDKDSFEDSLKDLKKPSEDKQSLRGAAFEKEPEAPVQKTAADIFAPAKEKEALKEVPKMQGAKKEAEDLPSFGERSKPAEDKSKKEDLLAGSKKAVGGTMAQLTGLDAGGIPKDAMKKKNDLGSRLGHHHNPAHDDFDDEGLDDPELAYPQEEEHVGGVDDDANDPNQLVASDDVYMSESYGYNFSVNSEAMEQFDYVEDVESVDSRKN